VRGRSAGGAARLVFFAVGGRSVMARYMA